MVELLTAAQMRAAERAAMASGRATGLELMERAGQGVVDAIFKEWPALGTRKHRAVVLCGPGNNGGDGFVVARLLKARGWDVAVYFYGAPAKLPPDARKTYTRWLEMGAVSGFDDAPKDAHQADLFVDALFGTGLTRPLEGAVLDWATACAADRAVAAKTVAVDIPSGLCSDSGRELAPKTATVIAGLTVTFHAEKPGHHLGSGPVKCGKTVVVDIGLPAVRADGITTLNGLPEADLSKTSPAHKYHSGHALVLSGGPGRGGAARLAARGALRIGAGLVTVGCPSAGLAENAAQLTAIMLAEVDGADGLAQVLADRRINALCIGPGLGVGDAERRLVDVALRWGRPLVLDADALTLVARDPGLFGALHDQCVLTPHGGEFGRLFPDIADKLAAPADRGPAYSKVDATKAAAARAGCVVLFKGADTVIADPEGRATINSANYDSAAPWLATAGSGDVLAGFVTGLLARGFAPWAAARTAAWLHVECARQFGPGLIAEDLADQLPGVFRALGIDG